MSRARDWLIVLAVPALMLAASALAEVAAWIVGALS